MNSARTLISVVTAALSNFALAQWTVAPTPYNINFGTEGPDGIPGTTDDLVVGGFGIRSGYTRGSYTSPVSGVPVTADLDLISVVEPAGNKWNYKWTLTNYGQGRVVGWFGQGPKFLKTNPLYGTAGLDQIPGNADDVAPGVDIDTLLGAGPPVTAFWNAQWNPSGDNTAMDLVPSPVPEPASMAALGAGVIGILRRRANRR